MKFFYESGNQARETRQEPTAGETGKKHTIKSRAKATTAFALRQVRDAIIAGGVISIVQGLNAATSTTVSQASIAPVSSIPMIGLIAIGAASFLGSKLVFKGVNKHTIKKREKGKISKKSVVATTIAVATPLTALLVGGFAPAAVVSIGVGAITLAKKLHDHSKKKKQEEPEARTESEARTR